MGRIQRALISVSDKREIVGFSRELAGLGVEILSTGGTASLLRENGVAVRDVAELTGFPEMLDGRVKTLHPKIHAGILALRDNPEHVAQLKAHGIEPIDLVVVNLYPFEGTVARGASFDEIVENIDIGGPSMVRAAAKNHAHVAVVVDPDDYGPVVQELKESGGSLSAETRFRLFRKAFDHTSRYDGAISNYFASLDDEKKPLRWGRTVNLQLTKIQDMRYGENPHQSAAFYGTAVESGPSIARARQIQGKELSFNNILDADAALATVLEFSEIAAVAIKHNNPCGVALSKISPVDAFRKAKACDPVSIFGGVIAFNRPVDEETARELREIFLEIVIAPAFTPEARAVLSSAKRLLNIRLLEVDVSEPQRGGYDLRRVRGGMLLQDWDTGSVDVRQCRVVTQRRPTEQEYRAMDFAWRVCRHVKSNAIVFASEDQVLGVGAGQMSRVDSARIAVMRAATHGLNLQGSAVASDAFYPFRDGIDEAARAGARAVIQPGGSIKDGEVIAAADEHGMAMVFTGMRHFRH
ncbi:MAG TPA: bifunctional phosphoribosylaminoimidazolecarboxamide formyltransferase/IMP cyclohydrolase [candidate division Zixibacteria bacterium]|nr:bifunctional phosphoribosylaminoimidazolecarboxamide formyltransferase/IMP cyclohydrolase [candidate division Zixibacteria bacterium]